MSQRHSTQNETIMLITTNIKSRRPLFQNPAYAREAIETLYRVQERYPFSYGFVVMPDHCHFLMSVPEPGSISKIMNIYKGIVSSNIGLGPIWQPRFHVLIPKKPQEALRYVALNPVRKKLVENIEDYPWSSACGKWDVAETAWYW
ncbi:transposase [Candidatus Peregrinibacteria bacterium]|nr:transposase [Candidatus Peregrinibacteria bacterium]